MRPLTGKWGVVIAVWAAVATAFQLYTAYIGFLEPRSQRSLHLLLFLPLAFMLYPARNTAEGEGTGSPTVFDILFIVIALAATFNSYWNAHAFNMRFEGVDPVETKELVFGALLVVAVLEAVRRAVTPILAGMICFGLLYLFTSEYWPGMMNYRDMRFAEIVEVMYLGNDQGIFGSLTGISTTMVAIFIAFGAAIEGLGLGRLFNNVGARVTGRQVGGPGKVAVVTSAFFGTLSGSATANVFSTGAFTIPMMKRLGYRPAFAGGVETASSVGGQLMPPIMGAGAFVMAEFTNIPYIDIAKAAALGAICYFSMLLMTVHFVAKRQGLKGMDEKDIPTWRAVARDAHLVLPLVVLLVLLVMRYSPHFSALCSIASTVVVSALRHHTRPTIKQLFDIMVAAGCNTVIVALACVGAGMFVAVLTVTGLVVTVGSLVTSLAGDSLVFAGMLLMVTSLVMGMGVPTTAAYVITASIGAPILTIEYGVPMLAAHMFVFYFAILADATPPVSIASYAAAAIAKCSPITTGLHAIRMALAGFIVAFSFLFSPALLLEGTWRETAEQGLITIGSLALLASGFAGYFRASLNWPARIVCLAAGATIALSHVVEPAWRLIALAVLLSALIFGARLLEPRSRDAVALR